MEVKRRDERERERECIELEVEEVCVNCIVLEKESKVVIE